MAISFDETYKNKVGMKITVRIGQAIKSGELSDNDLPEVCNYVLIAIETIKNHDELIGFLTNLTDRWPFFSHILTSEIKQQEAITSIESMFRGTSAKQ